jgi:hypothetical protein
VLIEAAGLNTRRVRIINLPQDVPEGAILAAVFRYGEVKEVQEEIWSMAYRYPVANFIRIAVVNLEKHIPSHIVVERNRNLVSYEGQPTTCYGCNETGHIYQVSPSRRRGGRRSPLLLTPPGQKRRRAGLEEQGMA